MIWNSLWGTPAPDTLPRSPQRDVALPDLNINYQNQGEKLERLILITQAMWELLGPPAGITEEMLIDKVKEIDLRDGALDNRRMKQIKLCQACGKVMNPRHTQCLYCGAESLLESVFDQI